MARTAVVVIGQTRPGSTLFLVADDRAASSAALDLDAHRRRAGAGQLHGLRCAQATGLNRRSRLEPPEPANRYCRRHPGELIHIDIKKLGRFDCPGLPAHLRRAGYRRNGAGKRGWDYCHVAVDDTSRLAYVEILDDETGVTCVGFLRRAIAERFIQTLQIEWAYAASYQNHRHRAVALGPWLEYYNDRRPHSTLGHKTPASRITAD